MLAQHRGGGRVLAGEIGERSVDGGRHLPGAISQKTAGAHRCI
jgi:hypothetical protein